MNQPLPHCRHRGREIAPDLIECRCDRFVGGSLHLLSPETCLRCPYVDRPNKHGDRPPSAIMNRPSQTRGNACRHRGEVTRTETCQVCPRKTKQVNVHACTVHGECTIYRAGIDVQTCSTCEDRDDSEPDPEPQLEYQPGPGVGSWLWDSRGNPAKFLRERYAGASVFLLCGGPSLADVVPQQLERRGLTIAALNNAAANHARPHMMFTVDSPAKFHPGIWRDPAVMKFCNLNSAAEKIRERSGHEWRRSETAARDCPNTWLYQLSSGFTAKSFLTQDSLAWECAWSDETTQHRLVKRSVFLVAVRMLYWLGFRTIYLVGADWHYRPEKTYGFDGCDKAAVACGSNNTTMGVLNQWMHRLRPHFEAAGLRIVNTTPSSRLTAFEHRPINSAIGAALNHFPQSLSTQGLYANLSD